MSNAVQPEKITRSRVETWLRIQGNAKPRVYEQIFAASEMKSLRYWLEIFFAAGIATFGLVQSSPAVIIGAMLISPLMGPIMATGLSLAIGDLYLGIRSLLNLLISITVSIAFSAFVVWLLPFHSATAEILARTNPNLLDLGIALLSGLAGSVVVCRDSGDGATALPGVAIAVALMPPLCTMGFGLGSGVNLDIMGGAGLLFVTNLVAIVASAFVVFVLVGMRTPEVESVSRALRMEERLAHVFLNSPAAGLFETGGRLRWRILMVLALLGSIAIPLRRALIQVANETLTRTAVQKELKELVPSDGMVSQQVTVDKGVVTVRLLSTKPIPNTKVMQARQNLMRRTGDDVQISVETVASQGAIAALMERLTRPPRVVTIETTIGEMRKELLDKVKPALEDIWPSADAPIQQFEVVLGTSGVMVEVHYKSAKELGDIPINMVLQSLRTKLAMPDLALKTDYVVAQASEPRKTKTREK